jgi:ribosome-associated heat shock protein Hsp15
MNKLRVDKWLWSVRVFKSRSMATTACKTGKVSIGDEKIKPSYQLQIGDIVGVKKNGFDLSFEVVKLIAKRVSASLAAPCYRDLTPEDELNKYKDWFVGKAMPERRIRGAGRPTKKERREIQGFKINQFLEELED